MSEESKSRIIDQSKIQSMLSGSVFSKILECDETLNRHLSTIEDLIKLSFYDYRPLARALYENLNEGDVLPDLYYKCVADIYKQLPRFLEMFS